MDFCGTGSYYGQESSNDLQLHLLVALCSAFANLVDDGINQSSWKCAIALWFFFTWWIEAIIRIVSIQQTMCHQLLHVVEYLLREAGNLGIQSQLHDAKVFVCAESLIISVCLD